MSFQELVFAFIEAIANHNQAEARQLGELMWDQYPEETAMFHLFVDTDNALNGVGA